MGLEESEVMAVEPTQDEEEIIERVAGLDVGKAEVVCCVRVPDRARPGRRAQEVRRFTTMTGALLECADWLRELGIRRVVMESTSDYWRPVFYVLEASGLDPWLVNARSVKHLPGRPKTDRLDAAWLARLAERQMLRPSFVPPVEIRQVRDLTRFRADLVVVRNGYKQRAEKLLEDAQIKISVVASDLFGVSGRRMMAALIAGERDPARLADLALGVLRRKNAALLEALTGRFNEHHAWLLAKIVGQVDAIEAEIAEIDERIGVELGPLSPAARAIEVLDEIPGIGPVAAAAIIAEIGLDMSRFPTPGHLCSWAGFAPLAKDSAQRSRHRSTAHGNRYLARILGDAVAGAGRTETFLGARYRRLATRRGKNVAMVAVARSMLMIIWHLLADPESSYTDLGADWHQRRAAATTKSRKIRKHMREIEALGFTVTVTPAA
jgi:transposase